MPPVPYVLHHPRFQTHQRSGGTFIRTIVIGLMAFLTVVDLFATQAILPSLARAYQVSPAAMGFAVNACTIGMAVAGLVVALFSHSIDRRRGLLVSLTVLAIPTALLAVAPGSDDIHPAADRARGLHGLRVHALACLSR